MVNKFSLIKYACIILKKFRQDISSSFDTPFMGLSNEKIRKTIAYVKKHGLSTKYVADKYDVSQRRIQQVVKEYNDTGEVPTLKKRGRKPYADYPEYLEERVIRAKKKLRISAVGIGHYLRKTYDIHVGNDIIHDILLKNGLAQENPNMRVRKKPWIRYERKHSLTAVHIDWHQVSDDEWVCCAEDDSSRKILSGYECERRSADASIQIIQDILDEYGHIRRLQQVISDHGSEFYANKRDKYGNADHRFEIFCKENGIQQILCRYNHPQSNGKIEKWFDTYNIHRPAFDTFEDFIHWYNEIRPHMSLDYKNLETPEKAFWKRLRGFVLGSFMEYCEQEMIK